MPDAAFEPARPQVLLGLIGAGIQQSLTPAMHQEEGRHHGLRLHYQLIDLEKFGGSPADLPGLLNAARKMGFAGLNITYPCKQAVIALLDELSDEARAMGAVNTVVNRNGRLIGHNTDGSGVVTAGFVLPKAHAALRLGVGELRIVDADAERAAALALELNARCEGHRANACVTAEQALPGATGLIHATPTGMAKLPGLPLDAALLRADLWVSEVVYFPLETALLQAARALGCPISDGGGMAVGQALGAFELFTGCEADPARVERHFHHLLNLRESR